LGLAQGAVMKRIIVGGLAISALSIVAPLTVANAADMALKAAPPPPAPVYSWTGCYIGANVGGAWAHKDNFFTGAIVGGAFIPAADSLGSANLSGAAYGGQIGCDYQLNTAWVVGIRGMWDGSNIKGSNLEPSFPGEFQHYTVDSFGTVVGKVGYLLNPVLELYGLGGVAWVHDKLISTAVGLGEFASSEQTRTGYDVGVGLSWMFAPTWDLFVEYDHMGFGTKNIPVIGTGAGAGITFYENIEQSVDKFLVGIDYRFAVK
jgi:outer membrane immunogenic protein